MCSYLIISPARCVLTSPARSISMGAFVWKVCKKNIETVTTTILKFLHVYVECCLAAFINVHYVTIFKFLSSVDPNSIKTLENKHTRSNNYAISEQHDNKC